MPNVTSIGTYAFYNCNSLMSIELPNVITLGNGAFRRCSNLTSILIPNVTNIGESALSECSSLSKILITNKVSSMGVRVFDNWTNQQTIYIEAKSRPSGWNSNWNSGCSANIVWGYKGE